MAKVLETLDELVDQFGELGDNLVLAVEESITVNNKAWESGHVTGRQMKEILDQHRKDTIEAVNCQLQQLRAELKQVIQQGGYVGGSELKGFEVDVKSGVTSGGGGAQEVRTVFHYDGRHFAVPKGYQFPKANLRNGLRFGYKIR